jgi:hypothetical protein
LTRIKGDPPGRCDKDLQDLVRGAVETAYATAGVTAVESRIVVAHDVG